MARKAFQTPDEHAAQIDQLVRNTVISIARDVEKGHFGGMTEDRIVEEVYRKYAGLLMDSGSIERAKQEYAKLYADAVKSSS